MHRIFIREQPVDDRVVITGDKAAYLSVVLRTRPGDALLIQNNGGQTYRSKVLSSSGREVVVVIEASLPSNPEPSVNVRLFQALLKGAKMDLVIQKTVELGVTEIVPVVTERSQVRETRKLGRWQKIAEEAARQSGRSAIPFVHDVMAFAELWPKYMSAGSHGVLFWEQGGENLHDVFSALRDSRNIDLVTGPEGGLSGAEVDLAVQRGFTVATLGRRILRAETAAVAALALVQYELGDLGLA